MTSTPSAQRAAILSLIDIVEGRVSKPKPEAVKLIRDRAYDACASLATYEWCVENRDLILKARELEKVEKT